MYHQVLNQKVSTYNTLQVCVQAYFTSRANFALRSHHFPLSNIPASFACEVETKDEIKLGNETIISLSAAPL